MPNRPSPPGLTRRGALAGIGAAGAALALAGCTGQPPARTAAELIANDPLGPLYTETQALIATYDRTMQASPRLIPLVGELRDEHRQHAVALASLIGLPAPAISPGPDRSGSTAAPPANPTPVASVAPSTDPGSTPTAAATPTAAVPAGDPRAALVNAEKTAQGNAVAACLAAPAGRVAVLASIAACRATHVAALR